MDKYHQFHINLRLSSVRWFLFSVFIFVIFGLLVSPKASRGEEVSSQDLAQTALQPYPVGGPVEFGDPVGLGNLTANYIETDLTINGSLGAFSLTRSFTTSFWTWWVGKRIPRPFGTGRLSFEPEEGMGQTLHWWHNLHGFIYLKKPQRTVPPQDGDVTAIVRDPTGAKLEFVECEGGFKPGQPCMTVRRSSESKAKLYWTGNGFVLYKSEGRYFFESKDNNFDLYRLTSIDDAIYAESGTVARRRIELTYDGDGFLAEATTEDGIKLKFHYQNNRLFSVGLTNPDGTETTIVEYGVDTDTGLLAYAFQPEINRRTTYEYGTPDTPVFRVRVNGRLIFEKKLDKKEPPRQINVWGDQMVLSDANSDRTLTVSGDSTPTAFVRDYCLSSYSQCGQFDRSTHCKGAQWQSFTDADASFGDGSGNSTQITHSFLMENICAGGPPRTRIEKVSKGNCQGANCDFSVSGQTQWNLRMSEPDTATALAIPLVKNVRDKRGNWTTYDYQINSSGLNPVELTAQHIGASDESGNDALRVKFHSYQYGGESQTPRVYEQLPRTNEESSTLGNSDEKATTHFNYDLKTNRLKSVIRSGWTQELNGAGSITTIQKFIGRFYFLERSDEPGHKDPLSRTLEIHGPCFVQSIDSTDCDAGGAKPIVQYFYWDKQQGNNSNRLHKKRVFTGSNDASGNPVFLDTSYDVYDARGHILSATDANGVMSTSVYQADRLIKSITSGAVTEHFFDDEADRVTATKLPSGNYEIFCYRRNTSSNACTGGEVTDKLQWKAKSATRDGSSWTEKILFAYKHGQLIKETYLDSTGTVRRIKNYDTDPKGRPTYEAWGNRSYSAVKAYDSEDNLTGIGAPYNDPKPLCDDVGPSGDPKDFNCSELGYDRANRLIGMQESPRNPFAAQGGTSRVDYDAQGNIRTISTGCDSVSNPNPTCKTSTLFQYDDFGNVVSIKADWLDDGAGGKGITHFEYDALGNVIKKQTPAMVVKEELLEYSYDDLNRLLAVKHDFQNPNPGSEVLYAFAYDRTATPDPGCPNVESANAMGRVQLRVDSFGKTWYQYNALGSVTALMRERTGVNQCSTIHTDNTPNSEFRYLPDGRLLSETYPHGRVLHYSYYPEGSGQEDRLSAISVDTREGGTTTEHQVIRNINWEPYGGLRAYELIAPLPSAEQDKIASVEYLLGGDDAYIQGDCSAGKPNVTGGDYTGRLKALWVSRGPLSGASSGDIFKRAFGWKADQLTQQASCLLSTQGSTQQIREDFPSYGGNLQLIQASRPANEFFEKGGAFNERRYAYDTRGNRISEIADCWRLDNSYDNPTHPDWLTSRLSKPSASVPTPSLYSQRFTYDLDGRVKEKLWPNDSTGGPAYKLAFNSDADSVHAAIGQVYRSVQVNDGPTYEYFYDAYGRRRLKRYPTGDTDEFFHDGIQLLEDRGIAKLNAPAPFPIDEYIWLDGRPVAFVKSKFDGNWQKHPDFQGDCGRNGETAPCGIYFIINDYLPKPVLILDSNRKVAGVADYDPFGQVNRVTYLGDTAHPYPKKTDSDSVLGYFHQPVAPGTNTRLRARFSLVDTRDRILPVQDFAYLSDRWGKDLGNNERIYGEHRGAVTSKWVNVPADGYVDIRFWAASPDNPDWGGAKTGVVVDGYEYQRYEAGATPVWTPLRMPGQYHDAETDLFENWNRFYDPSIGRYFQPDPLAYDPGFTGAQLSSGLNTLTYSYANNNPIGFTDPEGKFAFAIGIAACAGGGCEALIAGAIAGAAAGATVTVAYIAAKLNAIFSENQKDADKPSSEEAPTNENTEGSKNPENTEENKNTNPYSGPVDRPVIVVDESGNAIPVAEGEQIVGSPNGDYQQILGPDGKPTGLRIDRGGHKNQKDPRARGPHGHVPGVTLPDGNPHLPIRH